MVKRKLPKKDPEVIMEYDFNKVVQKGVKKVKKQGKTKGRLEKEAKLKEKIEAPINSVIQELLDSEKTFVENITRKAKKSALSAFYPFPKKISFLTVGKDETVVLVVRHHWVSLIPKMVLAFFILLFPFLLSLGVDTWFEGGFGSAFFVLGLFVFFTLLTVSILIDGFFKWFFEMNIITTKRIIDIDFVSIMNHRVSETTFDQVQDVSHSPAGPLAAIFDYGNLFVQTAAAKSEFEFNNIPRPRDVQDTILDLRELRREKFARGG